MRIKSYFAPSVQAAITLARKEFHDGVTLVTCQMTSLDNRHLGEYEVVFAIEEPALETPKQAAEPPVSAPVPALNPAFNDVLQQVLVAPFPMHQDLPGQLEHIHSSLVALGLDCSLVLAFMTLLKTALPTAAASVPVAIPEPAPEILEPVMAPALPVAAEPRAELSAEFSEELPVFEQPSVMQSEIVEPSVKASAPLPFLSLFEAPRPQPRFSAAELAFMSSVSSPKEGGN